MKWKRQIQKKNFFFCRATDINFKAIECTKLCQEVNCVESQIDLILTDLATCFDGRLNRSVDLLLFNPPYVPTDEEPKVFGSFTV